MKINTTIFLRTIIYVLSGIIFLYTLKCITNRIKFKENFKMENKSIFTNNTSEVYLSPMNISRYLSVISESIKDNIHLKSNGFNNWEFEKIPGKSNVYIKTKSSSTFYYLTRNIDESGKINVFASPYGKGLQSWYIIDIADLPNNNPYKNIVNKTPISTDKNKKYVFIVTNPVNFENETKFLTANLNSENTILLKKPIEDSIWRVDIKKKELLNEKPNETPNETLNKTLNETIDEPYEPTLAVGDYPNNDSKESGSFMPTFLPIWNRTWYSKDIDGTTKSFTVKLNLFPGETSSQGTIVFNSNFEGSLKNAIYEVKSQGSDIVFGKKSGKDDKSVVTLMMLPKTDRIPSLPEGMPLLKGWIEYPDSTISICASDENNLEGVCLSTDSN